jgi:hypothetical protein
MRIALAVIEIHRLYQVIPVLDDSNSKCINDFSDNIGGNRPQNVYRVSEAFPSIQSVEDGKVHITGNMALSRELFIQESLYRRSPRSWKNCWDHWHYN